MWLGKIPWIMYIFSVFIMFFGYYTNQVFNNSAIASNSSYTYNALHTLASSYTISQGINTSLIFGDFLAGLTVVFGILTGNTISSALAGAPYISGDILLLIQIIFSLSSVALWVFIVAFRDM